MSARPEPTVSAKAPDLPPQTNITTNADFLAAVFIDLEADERPVVVGISGAIDDKTKWPAGRGWAPGVVDTSSVALNWYFTLSTYTASDGIYRRRKEQFRRAFGVMLDDIGTKAAPRERLDACPPSYLIETSVGNHQAGYLFDHPCEVLAQVEALQEALVEAGLCDSGAKGPSARVGRMPVGINGKYSPPQTCRLVEWHPDRRYSVEQMVELLELQMPQPTGARRKTKSRPKSEAIDRSAEGDVYKPRAAENAVLGALRQKGLYKQPLGSGRHDITCPWLHEHTDQIDHGTAYFEPSDLYPVGGLKCQHSHGDGRRIGALLEYLGVTFTEAKHKPTICVAAGELHRVVDAAERELAGSGRHYQRGGLIVSVCTDPGTKETAIKPVSANALTRALSAAASWERYDGRSKDFVVTDPPARHVQVLFDSENYLHLPVLQAIARQPYLRQDGSLMTAAGFDSASTMFGAFDERIFKVPAKPDKASAERALADLKSLLVEFSFAKPYDHAAALGAMLTAAVRPALPLAPMFHVKAPQISSGKSYLCSLIAGFAGPAAPSAYAFPTTEEECAKLLLSALMEAPPVVMFDNLTTDLIPFKALCSALTEKFLTGRVLGVSKTATVPTQALFLSSGNNVDAIRDMARRAVTITLDPACETPAARRFSRDPLVAVHQRRGHFVSLALTIVRAYIVAGCPPQELPPLGSYGEWTRLVRAPLAWLGQPDAATSIFSNMASDPDRETLQRLLLQWKSAFGTTPTAVRSAAERADSSFVGASHSELAEVVREIAEERGLVNRRRLGRWIARHQGRVVGGLKFQRDSPQGGAERWKVVTVLSGVGSNPFTQSVSDDVEAFAP